MPNRDSSPLSERIATTVVTLQSGVESLFHNAVEINCRPWKATKHKRYYGKEKFKIDLIRRRIIWPEENIAKVFPNGAAWFEQKDCQRCCQKSFCTPPERRTLILGYQTHPLYNPRRIRMCINDYSYYKLRWCL